MTERDMRIEAAIAEMRKAPCPLWLTDNQLRALADAALRATDGNGLMGDD